MEEESRQTNLEIVQRSKQEGMTTSAKKFLKKLRNRTRSWGDLAKEAKEDTQGGPSVFDTQRTCFLVCPLALYKQYVQLKTI